MSKLSELIKNLCPNGVPFIPLKTVCHFQNGFAFSSSKFKTQGEKILRIANISNGAIDSDGMTYFDPKDYGVCFEPFQVKPRDVVVAMSGATTGKIGYNYSPETFYLNQRVGLFRPDEKRLSKRYLFHWLSTQSDEILHVSSGSGAQPNLSSTRMMGFLIPLPPLEVQDEIVRILDLFTELTAELTAELSARKMQYEFYRDVLLFFDDSVPMVPLGEVSVIARGASPRPINQFITTDPAGVNWIKIGDVKQGAKYITSTNEKITKEGARHSRFVKPGDFILSNSMSFGRPYILGIEGCIHDGWLSISDFEQTFIPDFLYHLLSCSMIQNEMKQKASFGGAVQNLNADIVRGIKLPIPSFEKQKAIVRLLDKFDLFTTDTSYGLPAEIEARRKQYEYYRDRLLSFKEVDA